MREFINLNGWKLKYSFKLASIVFTVIVFILLGVGVLKDQTPDIALLVTVILGASIGAPLFIILVGTIRGTWDLKKRNKAFGTKPFLELMQHGFTKRLKFEKSKWNFSEPVLEGEIGNFTILAEVDTQYAPDTIRFQALIKYEKIGKAEVQRLNRKFKMENIELDWNGVTKKISIKDKRYASVTNLLDELNRFINIIEKENFEPEENLSII